MRRAILLAALALAGCRPPPAAVPGRAETLYTDEGGHSFYRLHDTEKRVTCWAVGGGGVFCIRDAELERQP